MARALQKKPKLLLVEDEHILARMYKEKFEQVGFKTILAFEAKRGLDLAKKEKPDVVVLDILLPKEDGLFFLEELRKDPTIAQTPVVAFSNYDDAETIKRAKKLGAKAYLIKTDHTPQQIIEKISSYIETNKTKCKEVLISKPKDRSERE